MRIRFTETVVYETEGPGKGPVYAAGSVHDFTDDFAGRWLRRRVAVVEPLVTSELPVPPLVPADTAANGMSSDPSVVAMEARPIAEAASEGGRKISRVARTHARQATIDHDNADARQ